MSRCYKPLLHNLCSAGWKTVPVSRIEILVDGRKYLPIHLIVTNVFAKTIVWFCEKSIEVKDTKKQYSKTRNLLINKRYR
jgi:hypothetical protein